MIARIDDPVIPANEFLPRKTGNRAEAIIGERDELRGVTENIIVGQPVALGTGSVDLFYIPEDA